MGVKNSRRLGAGALSLVLVAGLGVVPMAYAADDDARIAGSDRVDTAVKFAVANFKDEANFGGKGKNGAQVRTAFLASASSFADAVTAGPLRGPIFLVDQNPATAGKVAAALGQLKANKVVALGGNKVMPEAMVSAITAQAGGVASERVAGADRYETSVEIAKYWSKAYDKPVPKQVSLANGSSLVDAMTAGSLGWPILLTKPGQEQSAAVSQYLAETKPEGFIAVGGEKAVDLASLGLADKADAVLRISGKDRYDTAAQIAKQAEKLSFPETRNVGKKGNIALVNGSSFADAVIAGATSNPVLLAKPSGEVPSSVQQAVNELVARGGSEVKLVGIGGSKALPTKALEAVTKTVSVAKEEKAKKATESKPASPSVSPVTGSSSRGSGSGSSSASSNGASSDSGSSGSSSSASSNGSNSGAGSDSSNSGSTQSNVYELKDALELNFKLGPAGQKQTATIKSAGAKVTDICEKNPEDEDFKSSGCISGEKTEEGRKNFIQDLKDVGISILDDETGIEISLDLHKLIKDAAEQPGNGTFNGMTPRVRPLRVTYTSQGGSEKTTNIKMTIDPTDVILDTDQALVFKAYKSDGKLYLPMLNYAKKGYSGTALEWWKENIGEGELKLFDSSAGTLSANGLSQTGLEFPDESSLPATLPKYPDPDGGRFYVSISSGGVKVGDYLGTKDFPGGADASSQRWSVTYIVQDL